MKNEKSTTATSNILRLTNGTESFALYEVTRDKLGPLHGKDAHGYAYTRCNATACEHEHAPKSAIVWHDNEHTEEVWEANPPAPKYGHACDTGHRWRMTDAEAERSGHKCPICGQYSV